MLSPSLPVYSPFFGVTLKRYGPWLSQFRGENGSRGSLREGTPGPGGNITHLSSHHCGVAQSFPLVLALAGTRVSLPGRHAQGCIFLPFATSDGDGAQRACLPLPAYHGMSSGPAPPSLRVPCATHPALPNGHMLNPRDRALCVDLCVSLITELAVSVPCREQIKQG